MKFFLSVILMVGVLYSQNVSIEFIDSVSNKKSGEIGYRGKGDEGYLYLGTPNSPEVKIKGGNIELEGSVRASKYYKGDKELDSVRVSGVSEVTRSIPDSIVTSSKVKSGAIKDEHIESVSWKKLKDVPAGFADGVDNVGSGSGGDSVRAAYVADTVKKLPSNVITKEKLTEELKSIKINDSNVDSISWSKLRGIPVGFADGVDNIGENTTDSVRAAYVADTVRKLPSNVVTDEKLSSIKLKDAQIESIDWKKITNIPAGFADGVDNIGESTTDSVRASWISDSTKKIGDGSVTSSKIATGAVKDAHIESVSWSKVTSKPSSYPTTIPNVTGLSDSLTAHRNLINSKANSSHSHSISDVNGLSDTITAHRNKIVSLGGMIKVASAELKRLSGQVRLISNTSPYSWLSLTIDEQNSGYMIVTATSGVASLSGSDITYWALSGSIAKNSSEIGEAHNIHWNINNVTLPQVWSQTKVFYFTSSEKKSINLYFWRADCNGCGNIGLYDAIISAIFIKDTP